MPRLPWFIAASSLTVASVSVAQYRFPQPDITGPETVRFPAPAKVWGAAADTHQQVHIAAANPASGDKVTLRYLRSDTAHARWPIQTEIPTGDDPVTIAGNERAPRIVVTNDGAVFIAWQSKDHIAARRSADEGKTWTPVSVRDADAQGGIDMLALAYTHGPAGKPEQIVLLWNDSRGHGKYSDQFSTALYAAVSTDGAKTFAKNIWLNPPPSNKPTTFSAPGACPCCLPSAQFDGECRLWIAYRSSDNDIKEITVLRLERAALTGANLSRTATAQTISHDNWHMVGCPMSGPRIAVEQVSAQTAAVVWTRDNETRYSIASLRDHWSAPKSLGHAPRIAALGFAGDLSMLWGDDKSAKLAHGIDLAKAQDAKTTGAAVLIQLFSQPALVVPDTRAPVPKPASAQPRH